MECNANYRDVYYFVKELSSSLNEKVNYIKNIESTNSKIIIDIVQNIELTDKRDSQGGHTYEVNENRLKAASGCSNLKFYTKSANDVINIFVSGLPDLSDVLVDNMVICQTELGYYHNDYEYYYNNANPSSIFFMYDFKINNISNCDDTFYVHLRSDNEKSGNLILTKDFKELSSINTIYEKLKSIGFAEQVVLDDSEITIIKNAMKFTGVKLEDINKNKFSL